MTPARRPSITGGGLVVLLLLGVALPSLAAVRRLEFLGQTILEPDTEIDGAPVGGLSGLTYDRSRDVFYAISDDPSVSAPARFFTLGIDLTKGTLEPGGARVLESTELKTPAGEAFARKTIDAEGIALSPGSTLFISSEGHAETFVAPFLREFELDGKAIRSLPLDDKYLPRMKGWIPRRRQRQGVQHNMALESLTLSPAGRWLFVATENALHQDGPTADLESRSPSRIIRYDAASGEAIAEYLYWTERVPHEPIPSEGFRVNGLVELLAIDENRLLALERAFSVGVGNTIRIFEIDLEDATDIRSVKRLDRVRIPVNPAKKTLLLDLAELGVTLDNLEGLTLGPPHIDGRQTLVLVSDDNFNPEYQMTQILAFAWSREPATVSTVQGPGHRSPLEGTWVFQVPGLVTAVDHAGRTSGFWIQDPRLTPREQSSTGLFVSTHEPPAVEPGDEVLVSGRVDETEAKGALPLTRIVGGRLSRLSSANELPEPVGIDSQGSNGREVPTGWVDDDGLTRFEPARDAIDFFESLEGLLVQVEEPIVVGPGDRFGGCVVVAGGMSAKRNDRIRTARGGLALGPRVVNPERILVSARLLARTSESSGRCDAAVGDRFQGPITGVLHYEFGSFRLLATQPLPATAHGASKEELTRLRGGAEHLTIATYNVYNLDPGDGRDGQGQMDRLARSIVYALGSPDILALQEIQDDNGREFDQVVSAALTFQDLIGAISAAGGPTYDFRQIDPVAGEDGGQPGGNIRVGYLYNPERIHVIDRGEPAADRPVEVRTDDLGPQLFPNPGRIAPLDPAFNANEALGYEASRKPLALEIEFAGRRVFLLNAHLRSKRADGPLFGSRQPILLASEEQRSEQAEKIRLLAESILSLDPEAAVVVLGDLNEHEFRAPLSVLAGDVLENLIVRVPPEDRYTYIFEGNSQTLDHILVSSSLVGSAEIDIVHINADEPDTSRASDHDPVLVRLRLAPRE